MSSLAFTLHDAVLPDVPRSQPWAPPQGRLRHVSSPLWTKTVSLANASHWLVGSLHRLRDAAAMADNWNSYGAVAPNETAVAHAQVVLRELSDLDFEPSRIDPSAEDGVCLSFRVGRRYADIECFNSGVVLAATSDESRQPDVWEVSATPSDLRLAIARIRAFLRP